MNHAITNQSEKEKQLKENMEQLKATQKKVYRQMEQLRGQERQRHHHNRQIVQVAILVGCRTSGNMKAVKVFLQKNWRKFAEDEDAAIDSALERVRLDCSSMSLTAAVGLLQEFDVGKKKRMGEKAKRFCKEYKLSQWVEEVNLSQGVTPYTQNVILEARNLGMIVADKQTKYKNQKQLLRRWRRRWNISLGSIACREGVLAHVAQAKAAGECFFWVRERNVAYRRYETGPIWWPPKRRRILNPPFGTLCTHGRYNGVHQMDPILGSRNNKMRAPRHEVCGSGPIFCIPSYRLAPHRYI
jgi:hypothetical protein